MKMILLIGGLCLISVLLFFGTNESEKKEKPLRVMTANWYRFKKAQSKLRKLVVERGIGDALTFLQLPYSSYLKMIETNYSEREFAVISKYLGFDRNAKREEAIRYKFEHNIINDAIVTEYLIGVVEGS